ncbi:MAG: peptide chain release factor N(5)-glutamine methyltransferase [Gammaproteobacteria bacterium]|jgi:release factor glutamine methyltransferase|nr:peptide chain release factor N(5)-glutamine methyltransferase [Gammaproteobacteria bacterium]
MRLDAVIADAVERLSPITDTARLDAEILLCKTIDMPRSYLFAHPEDELDALSRDRFETLLMRRLQGEPMSYITGTREFWSHELLVSPATLVPRPETELLVELALREIPRTAAWEVLDLGTGSGAIAISIAAERPLCSITATDASADALAIARQNVRQADLANVTCLSGNWTEPVADKQFTIIVSNPPYVREDDEALNDLRFEPLSALASGKDGLNDIRILATLCMPLLTNDGWLMMEHGADQKDAVAAVLEEAGWREITCHNDLAGLPRVTAARRNGK